MNRYATVIASLVLAAPSSVVLAAEVGPAVEAAPRAQETRNQTWASAAWCESAKCWLAVWREGYLNEAKGDIWCARVSAEGKPLDPAGIKLTSGEAFKDRPRVASDGKKFLVVWEEMPAGKDWDVYAAVVPAEGAPPGRALLLAGGEHNQCRPDVAFAKGNYHVVWMAYDKAYGIYGTRVAPDGTSAGGKPAVVAAVAPGSPDNPVQATLPVLAANAEGELLAAFHVHDAFRMTYLARRPIDAATGQPGGAAPTRMVGQTSPAGKGWGGRERTVALALGPDGALSVSTAETSKSKNDIIVGRLSKSGEVLGMREVDAGSLGISDPFKPISARFSVARAGQAYLAVGEVLSPAGDRSKGGGRSTDYYARVIGWRIAPDGNADGEPFAVAGEAGRECVLPSVAAGPDGSCLVVYSELRGPHDVKVLVRVVK